MAFNPITSAEINIGKPTKKSLWQKVKDNFDWLYTKAYSWGLLNGSLELDNDNDGIPDNWTRTFYPGGSGGIETTDVHHGAKAYYFTHPGGAGNGGGYLESDYLEVAEIENYYVKFIMRSTFVGLRNKAEVLFYDKAKVYISTTTLFSASPNDLNPQYHSYRFIPPANARFVKIRLIGGHTDLTSAGTVYFDGVAFGHVVESSITEVEKRYSASIQITAPTTLHYDASAGSYVDVGPCGDLYYDQKGETYTVNIGVAGAIGSQVRLRAGTKYSASTTAQDNGSWWDGNVSIIVPAGSAGPIYLQVQGSAYGGHLDVRCNTTHQKWG